MSGLIQILKAYKFTVTENTPIEEDVALDPELLGRVFENLLASYNPETQTTARKQTGSFYTPREIVNYMVDESLAAYLKANGEPANGESTQDSPFAHSPFETRLRHLLAYNDEPHQFSPAEATILIKAIDTVKILDPACGSGAFPMGILHKLVHILHKLDPNNEQWREVQRQKALKETEAAFRIGHKQERDERLQEISDVFEHNSDDYGRKLYLIENCIYGVDIQPIATQISKLRFFISLIVDQQADKTRDNFGVRPLPNLETKFVAANTLIGIEKPKVGAFSGSLFDTQEVKALEESLKEVRHRLFSAKTPATKRKLREEDKTLREKMGALLLANGWGNDSARQLAAWDPYDQNASSPFFDAEWMFGVSEGFDVVVGNPPYIRIQQIEVNFAEMLKQIFMSASGKFDIYVCFIEKGLRLLNQRGFLCYINPNKFFNSTYGQGLRKFISNNAKISQIIDFGDSQVFDSATTYTCILGLASRDILTTAIYKSITTTEEFLDFCITHKGAEYIKQPKVLTPWIFVSNVEEKLLSKLSILPKLETVCDEIFQGQISGGDKLFYLELVKLGNGYAVGRSLLNGHTYEFEDDLCYNLLKGAEIKRYAPLKAQYLAVFPYKLDNRGGTKLITEKTLQTEFPKTYSYFREFYDQLVSRGSDRMEYENWYAMWNPRSLVKFYSPKVLTQVLASRASYTLDETGKTMFVGGGNAGGYGIIPKPIVSTRYLLALLNSNLLDHILKKTSTHFRGGYYSYARRFIENLPIKLADGQDKIRLEQIADQILAAKQANPAANVSALEGEIDRLVYELYGLTAEEIEVVEGRK